MGSGSTFPRPWVVTAPTRRSPLADWEGGARRPGNSPHGWTVPETDTGGLVEQTEVRERTALKELGKLPP